MLRSNSLGQLWKIVQMFLIELNMYLLDMTQELPRKRKMCEYLHSVEAAFVIAQTVEPIYIFTAVKQ